VRIYLDTAPLIYLVEQIPPYHSVVANRLRQPGVEIVTSELSRMECRVKPVRENNLELLDDGDLPTHSTVAFRS